MPLGARRGGRTPLSVVLYPYLDINSCISGTKLGPNTAPSPGVTSLGDYTVQCSEKIGRRSDQTLLIPGLIAVVCGMKFVSIL